MKQLRQHLAFTLIISLVPVCKLWFGSLSDSTRGTDAGAITAFLFVGVSLYAWKNILGAEARPSPLGLAIILPVLWQLSWIPAADFWFLKAALILLPLGWLIAYDGIRAPCKHWRVPLACLIWAALCDGKANIPESALPWATRASAWVVTGVISPFAQITRIDSTVIMPDRTVLIGYPCTPVALWILTTMLLCMAGLLLQIPGRAWLRYFLAASGISILIGLVRLTWLVAIFTKPALFNYWHSSSGNAWFGASCILSTTLLLWRQVSFPNLNLKLQLPLKRPCALMLAATLSGLLPLEAHGKDWISPAPIPGYMTLAGPEPGTRRMPAMTGHPDVIQNFQYPGFDVTIYHIPDLLEGDADALAWWLDIPQTDRTFIIFLPDGTRIRSREEWARHIDSSCNLKTVLRWCLHRQPLRSKTAYWAAFHWQNVPDTEKPSIMAAFLQHQQSTQQN